MDVNGLRLSDEFRMHSPVVWLCFGIVVLLALSAQAGVQRNYHVIHQDVGPVYRNVLSAPSVYRAFEPQVISRRVQRQEDEDFGPEGEYDEDEEEEEEEEEEDGDFEPGFAFQPPLSGPGPFPPFDEEDEEEEEDEDEEGEEEEDDIPLEDRFEEDIEGRQAYINNQYVSSPNSLRQSNAPKPQNNNNVNNKPANNNNRKPPAGANRPNNANNNVAPNRRRPTRAPNAARPAARPNGNRKQGNASGQQVNANRPGGNKNRPNGSNRQKLQLRPVATSTQFIATPVADLILRLSISLAKPMGLSNSTRFNIPVRIQQGNGKTTGSILLQNMVTSRAEDELPKPEVAPISTDVPVKHEHEEAEADEHEDEKEDTLAMPATELPRK